MNRHKLKRLREMENKKIKAVVEQCGDGGFAAWSDAVPGVYANGESEEEVRNEFLSMMAEQAAYMEERSGVTPDFKGAEVEFTYALSDFQK